MYGFLTPHLDGSEQFDLGRKREVRNTGEFTQPAPFRCMPAHVCQRVTTLTISTLVSHEQQTTQVSIPILFSRECAALACPLAAMVPAEARRLLEGMRHLHSPIFSIYLREFCIACAQIPRAAPEMES